MAKKEKKKKKELLISPVPLNPNKPVLLLQNFHPEPSLVDHNRLLLVILSSLMEFGNFLGQILLILNQCQVIPILAPTGTFCLLVKTMVITSRKKDNAIRSTILGFIAK